MKHFTLFCSVTLKSWLSAHNLWKVMVNLQACIIYTVIQLINSFSHLNPQINTAENNYSISPSHLWLMCRLFSGLIVWINKAPEITTIYQSSKWWCQRSIHLFIYPSLFLSGKGTEFNVSHPCCSFSGPHEVQCHCVCRRVKAAVTLEMNRGNRSYTRHSDLSGSFFLEVDD